MKIKIKSKDPIVKKCEAIIAKYEEEYWGKPLRLAVELILKDKDYIYLTADEKAVFALLMTARAA